MAPYSPLEPLERRKTVKDPPRVGPDPRRFRSPAPTKIRVSQWRRMALPPPAHRVHRLSWSPQARREVMEVLEPRRDTYLTYSQALQASNVVDEVTCSLL